MTTFHEEFAAKAYRGLWLVLSRWLRVPQQPPGLPVEAGETSLSFHPAPAYLRYSKLYFWMVMAPVALAILTGGCALWWFAPVVAIWLTPPVLLIAVVPAIVGYVAIHLRYDSMWYVMSERSLRCRRGLWVVIEHTITFENVQNVSVRNGPVQYLFGISTLVIETAGSSEGKHDNPFAVGNKAILEGIDRPEEIRRAIMERVQRSRTTGLGDEEPIVGAGHGGWTPEHLRVLREIRDLVRAPA